MIKKYEYKIVPKELPFIVNTKKISKMTEKIENEINQLGAEEWELVQWKYYVIIFKREVV